jgi:hypothetical protein
LRDDTNIHAPATPPATSHAPTLQCTRCRRHRGAAVTIAPQHSQ